jgi:hypothetical protein
LLGKLPPIWRNVGEPGVSPRKLHSASFARRQQSATHSVHLPADPRQIEGHLEVLQEPGDMKVGAV